MLLSIVFWVHVILSSFNNSSGYPMMPFLDNVLIWITEKLGLSFVSAGVFAAISIYIIGAVTKGNIKFGLKIPFFFTIHPMKPNETLMNSFLFNVWLILTSAIGVIQFLTGVFPEYTANTSAEFFFDIQVKYLKFYKFFFDYNIFEFAFLAWSLLTLVWLWICDGREERLRNAKAKSQPLLKDKPKIELQTKK